MKYLLLIISSILSLGLLIPLNSPAQNINLPFTASGLGIRNTPHHAAIAGMGGLSATYNDIYRFNHNNPASLGLLRFTSLTMGAGARRNVLQLNDQSETQWSGQINYIHVAFPLQNYFNELYREEKSKVRLGAALHLVPFTRTDYSLNTTTEDPSLGNLSNEATGNGESYNAMFSLGANYKNISLGASAGVFFGNKTTFSTFEYLDVSDSYQSLSEEFSSFLGFNWNAGAIYRVILNKKEANKKNVASRTLQIGATLGGNTEVKSLTDQFAGSIYPDPSFRFQFNDTTLLLMDEEEFFRLPVQYSFGISYTDYERWTFGVNFEGELWDESAEAYLNQNLNNAFRFSTGVEYTPDRKGFGSYFSKINYRFGAYTGEDYRFIDGNTLTDRGLTAGLGLPFFLPRQRVSYLDIAIQYGQMQVGGDSDIQQNYLRLNFGFTINDNSWFYKQKYQ